MIWFSMILLLMYAWGYFVLRQSLQAGDSPKSALRQFLLTPIVIFVVLITLTLDRFGNKLQRRMLLMLGGRFLKTCDWCQGNGCGACEKLGLRAKGEV